MFRSDSVLYKFIILVFCCSFSSCSQKPKVVWEHYAPQKLAEAKTLKMPVVIDFYADWCISCHELERYTYADPEVIQALSGFKRLQVDLTTQRNKDAMDFAERFNIEGLPTVVFLDAEGNEIKESRIEGFVRPKEFLKVVRSLFNPKAVPKMEDVKSDGKSVKI